MLQERHSGNTAQRQYAYSGWAHAYAHMPTDALISKYVDDPDGMEQRARAALDDLVSMTRTLAARVSLSVDRCEQIQTVSETGFTDTHDGPTTPSSVRRSTSVVISSTARERAAQPCGCVGTSSVRSC
jgi:hypothetical protein